MPAAARLIIADSEFSPDLFWATRFTVPDPICFFEHRGRKYLVASDLEFARAKKEADVDLVLSTTGYLEKAKRRGVRNPRDIDIFHELFRERKIRHLEVPTYFPYRLAEGFRKLGYRLTILPDPFYPARMVKTAWEKREITKASRATEEAIRFAIATLHRAKARSGKLYVGGTLLTSELLRRMMEIKMLELGALGRHTIVAGGRQAADPHCIGQGPLCPNQTIVLDVFPKSVATGYFADITRTVVKGKASDRLKAMYAAVRAAQAKGISMVRHGMRGENIHAEVSRLLESRGFRTGTRNGKPEGFIHGTGHGLGLEIHEPPRVSRIPAVLKKGYVVTIEPGLYYQDLGGIRIEDDIYVTQTGGEVIARLPRHLMEL